MKDEETKEATLTLNKLKKTVSINTASTDFVPRYLKYLFEYQRIPNNYKIIFTDKTFENIEDFILKGGKSESK